LGFISDPYFCGFVFYRMCQTPIRVVIKNCSWNKHVEYTLEMLSNKDPMSIQKSDGSGIPHGRPSLSTSASSLSIAQLEASNPHANAHPFFWSGPTFSTGYLEPLEEVEIVLVACFTQPGVYDINRWRLAVQVVKAQRRRTKRGKKSTAVLIDLGSGADNEEDDDEDQEDPVLAGPHGSASKSVGKGFMQMPNLAHYIQVSKSREEEAK